MENKKRKNSKPDKKPMTALQKRKINEAKSERKEKYQWIFINGKQVRVRRPEKIEGVDPDEFLRENADKIWLSQNGYYEILHERKMQEERDTLVTKKNGEER